MDGRTVERDALDIEQRRVEMGGGGEGGRDFNRTRRKNSEKRKE